MPIVRLSRYSLTLFRAKNFVILRDYFKEKETWEIYNKSIAISNKKFLDKILQQCNYIERKDLMLAKDENIDICATFANMDNICSTITSKDLIVHLPNVKISNKKLITLPFIEEEKYIKPRN